MGTRCELTIRDSGENEDGTKWYNAIELWKHYDGYPSGITKLLNDFAKYAKENCGNQPHKLGYAEDFASALIAFSAINEGDLKPEMKGKVNFYPQVVPRGNIDDAEYTYLIERSGERYANNVLNVKCYHDANQIIRDSFKNGTESAPDETFVIQMPLPPQSGIMMF